MRLSSIKLSGFKSFVDPTNFQVPGQLVGVVGPNGCGKSNIIDAVRWVLGESKASELRGESMQDVIFNGSTNRKPAGRASVELVFDNSAGKAAGQWSQYAEIAVKRTLTRDGTSTYYINGQPVRRRDIQDIFLGTGLGPRAYAIIGQGMISRIIESRPEELRVFLEEAAGVSKYKERRRETENRLSDTRENLLRVEDILRELNANLDKLEAQAAVANRFHQLQADQEEKQKLLWLLRRNEAKAEQTRSRLAPRLKALQQRHKRDRERLQRETMKLYADEKTSPLAGCLPMLAQAPVIAVVYTLFLHTSIAGHTNALLAEQLLGVPLGASLVGVVATGAAAPATLAVFAGVIVVIVVVAEITRRAFRPPVGAGPDASPLAGADMARVAGALQFTTAVFAMFVPLAAALYLATTVAWTLAQRVVLRRIYPLAPA